MRDYYTPSNCALAKIKLLAVVGGRVSSSKCQHKEGHHHHHGDDHSHDHSHGHSHDHSHDHALKREPNSIFKIGISLNLLFVFIEIYYGYVVNSLALISDAFHNLTDVFALLLSWLGYYLSKKNQSKKYSLYAAFFNSAVLILGCVWVVVEAFERFKTGHVPVASTMMVVASIGFVINFVSAKLFHVDLHDDLNMKSAYMHLMADAAISLGVVVTGALIYFFSSHWIDPVVSILISLIIIVPTVKILKESYVKIKNKEFSF